MTSIQNRKKRLKNLIQYFENNKFVFCKPINLYFRKKLKSQGQVEDINNSFKITFRSNLPDIWLDEVLIHELAHCLAGWPDDANTHTDMWGKWYARLYTCYLKK